MLKLQLVSADASIENWKEEMLERSAPIRYGDVKGRAK